METNLKPHFLRWLLVVPVLALLFTLNSCGDDEDPDTANNAPNVTSAIADLSLSEGFGTETVNLTNVFTDSDGDNLTFTATSSTQSVVTVGVSGNTLTITEAGTGTSTVTVTANDGNGGTVADSFLVGVSNTSNTIPTVASPIGDINVDAGFGTQTINFSDVFLDADGDQLTVTAASADESVVTVAISGTTLTITEVATGQTMITLTADDGNGGVVSDVFVVTVSPVVIAVGFNFGTNTGTSIEIDGWTGSGEADGYVVVINDANSFTNLTNGDDPAASTSYVGTGEQVIYNGTATATLTVSLLQAERTYYFKLFPYTGAGRMYNNDDATGESAPTACVTTSTTESQVCFSVTVPSDTRTISSNQFPSHAVGNFPNADPAARQVERVLDLTPEVAASITYVFNETGPPTPSNRNFWQFGIATNGVEFHPMGLKPWAKLDAGGIETGEENWEWQEQVTEQGQTNLDAFGAHVTSDSNYHYHGDIVGLATNENGSRHSLIYGFAADGFPIYYKYGYTGANDATSAIKELISSYRLKSRARTGTGTAGQDYPDGNHDGTYIQDFEYVDGLGDLDECNGRTGVTPEYPKGTYYYVITSDFPVTPNCFKGTPADDWIIGK